MPVRILLNGGVFKSGRIEGGGELEVADEIGNIKIYKGNFICGKLNDEEGTYIEYNKNNYNLYVVVTGIFINNKMDGVMNITTYSKDGIFLCKRLQNIIYNDNQKKEVISDKKQKVNTPLDNIELEKTHPSFKDFYEYHFLNKMCCD